MSGSVDLRTCLYFVEKVEEPSGVKASRCNLHFLIRRYEGMVFLGGMCQRNVCVNDELLLAGKNEDRRATRMLECDSL